MTLENVRLKFRLGDTWSSEQWAVLVDDLPVDLSQGGWSVRCQVRRTDSSPVLHEWSLENGRVELGSVSVAYGNTGEEAITSTVKIKHSAEDSDAWDPFAADFELEIERGSGPSAVRYTIVSGRMFAVQDLADV